MKRATSFQRDLIHQGDCARMAELPDGVIDLVVAGPPYWRLIDYQAFARDRVRREAQGATYEAFLGDLRTWFAEVFRVLRPGRYCAVNLATVRLEGRVHALPFHAVKVLEEVGFEFCWEIVWHKPAGGRRSARTFMSRPFAGSYVPNNVVEYVLVFRKQPNKKFATRADLVKHLDNAIVIDEVFRKEISNNVWHFMPAQGRGDHPCPFPPGLPLRLIGLLSLRGETVLDPFMGSGTTARAARALGRHYVGYEREPEFVATARRNASMPIPAARSLVMRLEQLEAAHLV